MQLPPHTQASLAQPAKPKPGQIPLQWVCWSLSAPHWLFPRFTCAPGCTSQPGWLRRFQRSCLWLALLELGAAPTDTSCCFPPGAKLAWGMTRVWSSPHPPKMVSIQCRNLAVLVVSPLSVQNGLTLTNSTLLSYGNVLLLARLRGN
jgi:hypothetical protein